MKFLRAAILALAAAGLAVTPLPAAEAPPPCAGCTYHFLRLVMPSDRFTREMIPMFDNQLTFDALTAYLDEQRIFWSIENTCIGVSEFPAGIQKVLAGYGPGDNILGRAHGSLLILKIQRLHASRQACLQDLPARNERTTGTKRPEPRDPNATSGPPAPKRWGAR